jgi:predicted nucleotidyltransferase
VDLRSRQSLVEALRGALGRRQDLGFAILFGSRARGSARPDSDVDIAISPTRALSISEENALALELERCVGASVDLVVLDRAPPALRWRIARDGVVIVSAPPSAATRFLAHAGIEHDDVRELEREAMQRFRAAVARAPTLGGR